MQNNLAPIGVSTYSRLGHLQETIAALQNNPLAKESELYIFSDAPRLGDKEKVAAVRKYLRTIDGFKAIHIIERTENNRVANNRGGIRMLLDKYGKMIFLEEDVVTAPGFLRFMNDALEFYKDNPRIGSISAYCPPIDIPDSYPDDVFALTRFNPWGVGLWSRYYRMDTPISKEAYSRIFNDKKQLKMLARSVGQEALPIIKMDVDGELNAGDMKSIFWQFVEDKISIYPRRSLVQNIGQDGTGLHMGVTNKWDISKVWNKTSDFKFVTNIAVDEGIRKAHYDFYKADAKTKLIQFMQQIGIYQYMRPIVKKIQHKLSGSHAK